MELSSLTDEQLIESFVQSQCEETRDFIFQFLIERHKDPNGDSKKSWKIQIHAACFSFLKKCPFLVPDYNTDIMYNRVLMNLFQAIDSRRYDTVQPFKPYFNSLIFKTLLNIRRNFNLKKKKYVEEDVFIYESPQSLDDGYSEITLGETIASDVNLEEQFEKRELLNFFLDQCKERLSETAFLILLDNGLTKTLTSAQLARRFKCSGAKIASIKNKEIVPVLADIKHQMSVEFGIRGSK